jgi:hypothetical protein
MSIGSIAQADIDCLEADFQAGDDEPPAVLVARLKVQQNRAGDPLSNTASASCMAALDTLIPWLSWMDYDLCYVGESGALGTMKYDAMVTCRHTCGFCYLNPAVFPAPAINIVPPFKVVKLDDAFEECLDSPSYQDVTGSGCSWYFLNDRECNFADKKTVQTCAMTCRCTRDDIKDMNVFDYDEDGILTSSELRSVNWNNFVVGQLYYGGDHSKSSTQLRSMLQVELACPPALAAYSAATGDSSHTVDGCIIANMEGIDVSLPYSPDLIRARETNQITCASLSPVPQDCPTLWKTVEQIQNIHDPMRTRMMKMNNGDVRNYKEDLTVISSRFSLSKEPLVALFPGCDSHAACNKPDLNVMLCPPSDPNCPFRFESWGSSSNFGGANWGFFAAFGGQKQFCSKTCMTGGCGSDATALPQASPSSGGYCQPCGGCTSASGLNGNCPAYCTDYIRDDPGGDMFNYTFPFLDDIDNPYTGAGQSWTSNGLPQTVSVAGLVNFQIWVNTPANRWVVKKYFPDWPLSASGKNKADAKCADVEDAGKVCWAFTLQEEGFCYRSWWGDTLRFIPLNGLRQRLQSKENSHGWHQLSMEQFVNDDLASGEDYWYSAGPNNKRKTTAEMVFYVDLNEIGRFSYSSHKSPDKPYFVDCAGEMVESVILPSQSAAASYPSGSAPASKVAFGGAHHAAMTFSNVKIPRGATIQSATLELVPSLLPSSNAYPDISKALDDVGKGKELVNIKIGVSTSPDCSEILSDNVQWAVNRADWETAGLRAECVAFGISKDLCRQDIMASTDFKDPLQNLVNTEAWTQGGDLSVHLRGNDPLTCGENAGFVGALPVLRVTYCMNDVCVSPRWMGASPLFKPPIANATAEDWEYQSRRLQGSTLRSQLAIGSAAVYGMKFVPEKVSPRLIQQEFYTTLDILSRVEIPVNLRGEKTGISIPPLPSQITMVAPPVILQARAPPGAACPSPLSQPIAQMLNSQMKRKCELSYTCDTELTDERVSCYDRLATETSARYYDKDMTSFQTSENDPPTMVYAEFANMLRETTVYRDGEMMSVDDWINSQTNQVVMLAVFSLPYKSITTVMRLDWKRGTIDGSGRFSGKVHLVSYKNIDEVNLPEFTYLIYINIFLNVLDVANLFRTIWKRMRNKAQYRDRFGGGNKKIISIVNKNLPAWTGIDLFDFLMRIIMTVMLLRFLNSKNYNPEGTSTIEQLSDLDRQTFTLTSLPWLGRDGSLQDKFSDLLNSISRIIIDQTKEGDLRAYSYFMLFAMLLRVIIYMNCHPRIAVLYGTILACLDDLMHFMIIASVIYSVFAYSAYWMIGSENLKFETLPSAYWSQFEMIIGEFPFAEQEASFFEMFYMFSYAMIVFVLLINSFLLAVVVGAYENVKDAIENCLVEQNVFWDVFQSFYYPAIALKEQWPDRPEVAIALAGYDVDNDGKADSGDARIRVVPDDFMKLKNMSTDPPEQLFKSRESAVMWMNHFAASTPVVAYNFDPPVNPLLMHQQTQLKLTRLAWLAQLDPDGKGADMAAMFDDQHETDEEKAQKAAETVVEAMKELSELIPSLGHGMFREVRSPKESGNTNGSFASSDPRASAIVKSGDYLAASEKLFAQMSALTEVLDKQPATRGSIVPLGGAPLSIQPGTTPTTSAGVPITEAAALEAVDGADLRRLLSRLDEKMERMLANQEFVRSIAQNAGGRPAFASSDRADGPNGHRQIGHPRPAPDDGGLDSSRFLAECLHPELEEDQVVFSDRHPNGGVMKETYAPR